MKQASELTRIPSNYAIWQVYDPPVKADLFSTALIGKNGVVVIDPIPLSSAARDQLGEMGEISAVLISNANHARAVREFPVSLAVPPDLHRDFPHAQVLTEGGAIHGLEVIAVQGAAPGEFAFYDARDGGTLIVGDVLINFEPHGFGLLPPRYCQNRKLMIRSLRRLLDLSFTRIFFAHGFPFVSGARDRLATLLDEV
jgi:glyoxylase-like metal-dependent hydrolase (beta-lactamase superfamily II)